MNLEEEFEFYAFSTHVENRLEEFMQAETALALRSISASIDLVKRLVDIGEKSKNSELILAIANLNLELSNAKLALAGSIGEMAELKAESSELKAENRELKEKIRELETQPQEKLLLKNGLYYKEDGDGAFCTACYDDNRKKIRVVEMARAVSSAGKYRCPVCKTFYLGK